MTSTLLDIASEPSLDPMAFAGRTVLLATDGSLASVAAARVALALAHDHHVHVHVISVLDTRPAPLPPPLDLALAAAHDVDGHSTQTNQAAVVRDALSASLGEPVDWPVHIVLGVPAQLIAQEARRMHAALIVLGLRRHGALDRALHDETTLGVIRRAHCPVLAVTADAHHRPSRVLAAMDFSQSSEKAARRAGALVAPDGVVVLAYVPPLVTESLDEGEVRIREMGIAAAFEQCERELADLGAMTRRVILRHKLPQSISKLLLDCAESSRADLIAAGSVRHGRMDRWLLGSVTTELVRAGRRSLLIVPPTTQL